MPMLLACTRFNTDTYAENREYRKKMNWPAIYGTPIPLCERYICERFIYVLEMNNDTNRLEGISIMHTRRVVDRQYRIHANTDYNWNVYKGLRWIGHDAIERGDSALLEQLELMLFYGRSHMKRMLGITVLSSHVFYQWDFDKDNIMTRIIRLLPPPGAMVIKSKQILDCPLDNLLVCS